MSTRTKIVFLFLGLGVFTYLVLDFGIPNIILNVQRTGWWFGAIIAVWMFVYLCNALAWYLILRDHSPDVSFWSVCGLTITGFAINYVTPFLNLGGEPYRVMALRERIGVHRAASSVISYNMVRMLSHLFFWLAGIAFAVLTLRITPAFGTLLAVTTGVVLLLIWFFFSRHKKGIFKSLMNVLGSWSLFVPLKRKIERRQTALLTIDRQIKQLYNEQRWTFYRALGLEFLSRVIASWEFYFILYAIGQNITFAEAIYINAGSSLILNLLFFVPFEAGVREGGLYLTAGTMGFAPPYGIYIGLINRVREFFWILVGLILLGFSGRQRERSTLLDIIEARGDS
ncbi:MAG: flippase-like domain-containing protein [Ignavibacteriae bacterium]|nr:flippase-like domain-containing protein [Ignavibacteriota bacterium]